MTISEQVQEAPKDNTANGRDLLLSALRAAKARARLTANEFDTLRQKLITCEQALQWARDEGLIDGICLSPQVSQ